MDSTFLWTLFFLIVMYFFLKYEQYEINKISMFEFEGLFKV
jgi:hypothetical protein